MRTAREQAVDTALQRQRFYANFVFTQWVDHPGYLSPQDSERADWEWRYQFREAGQHEVTVSGFLEEHSLGYREAETIAHGGIDSIVRKNLEAPKRLYRAAAPGYESRWNWFDRFDLAKLVADHRSGGLRIWTCEPETIFGVVRVDRVEGGGHRERWNEWIVKPKNVQQIDRWRDPFVPVLNLPQWEKRGVQAVIVSSIIGSWARASEGGVGPMERDHGEYWLTQFEGIGQFEAYTTWDAADRLAAPSPRIEPAYDLQPPTRLYRGSPEATKRRWSWTAEVETAQMFVDMFCPEDGKIWTAEPERIFGVIHAHAGNVEPGELADFTEWIVLPREDTIRELGPSK